MIITDTYEKGKKIPLILKIFAIFISTVVIVSALSFRIPLGNVYYIAIVCTFFVLYFLTSVERKFLNRNMFFLTGACFLSILLNDVPSLFSPYLRLGMFMLVLGIISPLINSYSLFAFRKIIFVYFNYIIIILSALSFLGLVTGVYVGLTERAGVERPDFTGLFNHSMTLGPMSGVAIITCLYKIYSVKGTKTKLFFIVCALLCFMAAVSAGSRAAILGTIGGGFFLLYKVNQGRLNKHIKTIFAIVAMLLLTFPIWQERTAFLMSKVNRLENSETTFDSRTEKWIYRWREFQTSPVIGIGFASVDPKGGDQYDVESGTIEPGSSWLAILSMTGILGFIPFLLIFIKDFWFLYQDKLNKLYSGYLGGLLTLFALHLVAEGYVFASGAIQFFSFWLLLGIIEAFKYRS